LIPLALQVSALKCSGQKFITQQYKNEVLKEQVALNVCWAEGKHFSCSQNDIQAPSFLSCKAYSTGFENKTYSKRGLL